jgi:homoserine kinase
MTDRARAIAPATVANIGPGFDVLGLALEGPYDEVEAEATQDGVVTLVEITGDGGALPKDASKNCVGASARAVLDSFAPPGTGVRLWLHKGLDSGSGLGSSAASSVAAAVATAAVVCPEVDLADLLDATREGERLATGAPHPDNVAPSLLGGLVACVVREAEVVEAMGLSVAQGIVMVTVSPAIQIPTAAGRAVMPAHYSLEDVVANMSRVAGLVSGFASGDLDRIGGCLDDRLATPYRKSLIPGFDTVMSAARCAGAVGGGISGAGPTVFAVTDSRARGRVIGAAMVEAFARSGVESLARVSGIDGRGARLVEPGQVFSP